MQEVEKILIENWIYNVLSGYKLEENEILRERVFECVKKIYDKNESIEGEEVDINVLKYALEVLTYRNIKEYKGENELKIVAYSYQNDNSIKVKIKQENENSSKVISFEF